MPRQTREIFRPELPRRTYRTRRSCLVRGLVSKLANALVQFVSTPQNRPGYFKPGADSECPLPAYAVVVFDGKSDRSTDLRARRLWFIDLDVGQGLVAERGNQAAHVGG